MDNLQPKTRGAKRLFYGWVIMAACVLMCAATTGLISYTAGLFVKPVTIDMGIERSAFSLYSTISTVATMCILPFVGAIFKRFPLKAVMTFGALCGAAALIVFSFAKNIYVFYAMALFIGVCLALVSAVPVVTLISNWFIDKRGFATATAFTGSGIATMLLSSPITKLIEASGWRAAYRMLAVLFLVITLPVILLVLKTSPADMGLHPLGYREGDAEYAAAGDREAQGFTRAQAFKTKSFWIFAVGIFFIAMCSNGSQQHLVSYWTDIKISDSDAAVYYSVAMAVGVVSKSLLGVAYDKFGIRKSTILIATVGCAAFIVLLLSGTAVKLALISAILFGMSTAIQIVPPTYMTNKLFGDKDYSSIYGIITMVFYSGVSVGVPLCALFYDRFSSYKGAWILFAALIVSVVALLLSADSISKKEFVKILGAERKD